MTVSLNSHSINTNLSTEFDLNNIKELLSNFHGFESGEISNEYEMTVMDMLEVILGDRFRYCPQVPLEIICSRSEFCHLPNDIWKFWVNSKVDIALMERTFPANRQAKLVVECQSYFHNLPDVQKRDRLKAELLSVVKVPLIYVRRVDEDGRFYRFFTPDERDEIYYSAT
ncbi:hypothetical protein [Lyngbya sp. PCC 8106]|uniref:hypothetical protein n=1 Tax=Lyngbya sp. (strain PCC 8106) TaxID=313612 RepID=UPI0000EAD0A1|nr:hypothetical protein [Lyngbya sp. PCC 8106]EAW38320.1 hypothetical protein L8106_09861 [Lyngbya sp. PCC 8106]